ncbi:MAG: NUDIX domain-containing protein, partial [Candidatus Micrarchaeota archaeon]|nr:NUDIX domain-containing protein [Candidatus Micrarchaeota archaeon]
MATLPEQKYKLEKHDGIAAIIMHNKKILLLKRRNIPIILNRGVWSFLYGSRKRGERYIDAVYREISEEVKLDRSKLILLYKTTVLLKDERKRITWKNRLFLFRSSTDNIKLDFENSKYRWAAFSEIEEKSQYTNIFVREGWLLGIIKRHLAD